MSRISDEDIQRVRDATDVVSLVSERVVLKPKGRLQWGLCPFHGEKTPSFKVDPATQLWHCFGCGLGGDVFGFVMNADGVEFPDAVRILADRAHIELVEQAGGVPRGHKERLFAALDETAAFYARQLTGSREPGPARAREYLGGRGFGSDVSKAWRLGYAPGRGALVQALTEKGFSADEMIAVNVALRGDGGRLRDRFYERIMFPISDLQGRVIAFGGRIIDKGEPKYLNTNDTPVFHKSANLYAIDRAKASITSTGTAVVVEGYTDVIALHEAGVTSAVATLGTALTRQHVRLLGRFAKRIVYLFDGDEAGMRAADRASEFIDADVTPEAGRGRVDLLVAVLPDGLDPADYVAAHGAEALRTVIDEAVPLLRFSIDRRLARWDLERPEERQRALKDAAEVLAPVRGSLLADDYVRYIADRLMADFAAVRREVDRARVEPAPGEAEPATPAPAPQGGRFSAPLTPSLRVERGLLSLLVGSPSLRVKARDLLKGNLLSDSDHQSMAEVIGAEVNATLSPADLVGALESRIPGSARALSAVETGFDADRDLENVCTGLVRRLKEFELERRISEGKAALRRSDSFKTNAEYDELFSEVSAWQKELAELRRGVDDYR